MNQAVVSFGSNINPTENIAKSRDLITKTHKLIAESNSVMTKPIGFKDQDDFVNGAFLIKTTMSEAEFSTWLKNVEIKFGRIKGEHPFGPRSIDLDLIVWNKSVVHKDFNERDFIKEAVLELVPNLKY